MALSYVGFLTLPREEQVRLARAEGTFVGWRWVATAVVAGLYHLPGHFFCEVYLSLSPMDVLLVEVSVEAPHLAEYAEHIVVADLLR